MGWNSRITFTIDPAKIIVEKMLDNECTWCIQVKELSSNSFINTELINEFNNF